MLRSAVIPAALAAILLASLTSCAALDAMVANDGATEPEPQSAPPAIVMPANLVSATVNHVHDGDTLFLSAPSDPNLKVRLTGIDTPEVGDNLECYGDEATALLTSLLPEGTQVFIQPDREPLDRYGRSLLYLFTADGASVNLAMVTSGAAEAVRIGQNDAYWDQLSAAEALATSSGAGMWGVC
jgi:micrococcal nuclease